MDRNLEIRLTPALIAMIAARICDISSESGRYRTIGYILPALLALIGIRSFPLRGKVNLRRNVIVYLYCRLWICPNRKTRYSSHRHWSVSPS